MAKDPKRLSLSDQMRRAIAAAPVSRYRIAQETGVAQATLSRFVAGKCGISLESVDAIASYLGWNLASETQETEKTD